MEPDPSTRTCAWLSAEPGSNSTSFASPEGHPFCRLCDAPLRAEPWLDAATAGGGDAALRVSLRAGARLFERGVVGDAVYVLHSGIVKEVTATPDGGECIVRLVTCGGVCGLGALLHEPHTHSAFVIHPGRACRIPVAQLERLRAQDPRTIDRLFVDWQQAVADADRIIRDLGQGPARARLARALLFLRSAIRPGEPLRLRRRDLAQMMSVNPTTVARLLGDFRREALLQQRGRYCTGLDHARLQDLASGAA